MTDEFRSPELSSMLSRTGIQRNFDVLERQGRLSLLLSYRLFGTGTERHDLKGYGANAA